MTRPLLLAAALFALDASPALAQRFFNRPAGQPYGPRYNRFAPGYYNSGYPGARANFRGGFGGGYYGGYGYGGGYYGDPYIGDHGILATPSFAPVAPPLQGAGGSAVGSLAAPAEAVGEMAIEFPAAVTLTVNGQPVPGDGPSRTLTSRPLKPGETADLAVVATWSEGGKRYTWDHTYQVTAGARSRVTVLRGLAAP